MEAVFHRTQSRDRTESPLFERVGANPFQLNSVPDLYRRDESAVWEWTVEVKHKETSEGSEPQHDHAHPDCQQQTGMSACFAHARACLPRKSESCLL